MNIQKIGKTGRAPVRAVAVLTVFLLLLASFSWAAAPVVSNIQVQQSAGSSFVDITYDLQDDDGDLMHISAVVSLDGGNSWSVACRAVTGDVGPGVYSGTALNIVWDPETDLGQYIGDQCQVRVFATDVSPYPEMEYFRVVSGDTLSMSRSVPDTVGYRKPLHLLWRATTPVLDGLPGFVIGQMDTISPYDDGIMGYKWRLMEDNCNPEFTDCWHPRLLNEATGDSFSYFSGRDDFYFQNNDSGQDPWGRVLDSGEFAMRFTSRDIAGTEIDQPSEQDFSFVVNFDPETILLKGETDWAHPEDPEIYPYYTLLNDPQQVHYPFVEGDRIPDRSYVVFKALFRDDARDTKVNPAYTMGVSGGAEGLMGLYTGGSFSFQTGSSSVDYDPAWDEGINGFYADTLGFMPSPSTEFTFRMTGVDEHGRRDGTPDEMTFTVGHPPCVQCLELLPNFDEASSYSPDLACFDPEVGGHPCFENENVFYIKQNAEADIPGRQYMQYQSLTYLGIHRITGAVQYSDFEFDEDLYYSFESQVFSMGFFLHGKDDPREAWTDPGSRIMGWRYQVDYDCDPNNSIADGGGIDDLQSPTWGQSSYDQPGLDISTADGVWRMKVDIVVPTQLVQLGPETFQAVIQYTIAGGDAELAAELYNKCIRQLSSGVVRAVALDQTLCGYYPVRPAKYHVFADVRPPMGGPGQGTWRDCDPSYPSVDFSLGLSMVAMPSLENVPVENSFQIVFQSSDGDMGCQAEIYQGRLALPAWDKE